MAQRAEVAGPDASGVSPTSAPTGGESADAAPGPTRAERRRAREAQTWRGRRRARARSRSEARATTGAGVDAGVGAGVEVGVEALSPSPPTSRATPAPAPFIESARQARRRETERRRFWLVVMPLIVLALAVAVGIGALVRALDDDGAKSPATSAGADAATAEGTLALVHRGGNGAADFITVVGAQGKRASVLLVPTVTQVEVPSLGLQTFAQLATSGDAGLMQTTLENTLGIRVADTMALDDPMLASMLRPAAPLSVDLPREVSLGDEGDLPSGTQQLSAETATRALTAPQTGNELDRLVVTQAVLDGWMARLRQPEIARATLAQHPELRLLVDAARARERRTDTLPVQSVATGEGERFEVRRKDLVDYVRTAFAASLLVPEGSRPRVEILNGTGAVGVAQKVAAAVVPAGGEVTLSGNVPGFGLRETQVVYYEPAQRAAAQRLLDTLDCGSLKRATGDFKVVDVTILVGADCPAFGAPAG